MMKLSTSILRIAIFIASAVVIAFFGLVVWLIIKTPNTSGYYVLSFVLLFITILASIPFFIALFQSYKLLGYIDNQQAFSESSVKSLKIITYCALVEVVICVLGGLPFLYVVAQKEDAPGLVVIGLAITGVVFIIFVFTSILTRLMHEVTVMKNENEVSILKS